MDPTKQEALEELVEAIAHVVALIARIRGSDDIVDAILTALDYDPGLLEGEIRQHERRNKETGTYRKAVSDEAQTEDRRVFDEHQGR